MESALLTVQLQRRGKGEPVDAAELAAVGSTTDVAAIVAPDAERARQRLSCTRTVQAIAHPFFAKTVYVSGIPIRAAQCVDDAALVVAADRLSRQMSGLPAAVLARLVSLDAAVHVIGRGQVTSDLPEHAHMRGVDGGYTQELGTTVDERTRGMGGLKSSCGEENLLNLEEDPCYGGRDILTHEWAHAIMDFGLPPPVVQAIRDAHAAAVGAGLWQRTDGSTAYAGSNASEYWAELSMWYWGTHGEFVDKASRQPAPGPAGLARYDPGGFRLVGEVYDGSHAAYAHADAAPQPTTLLCALPRSAPASARRSVEGDGAPCILVLRNGGAHDASLLWIDAEGAAHEYGTVPAHGTTVQHTYAGHVWRLAPRPLPVASAARDTAGAAARAGPAPRVRQTVSARALHVRAEAGNCLIELWPAQQQHQQREGDESAHAATHGATRRARGRGRRGAKLMLAASGESEAESAAAASTVSSATEGGGGTDGDALPAKRWRGRRGGRSGPKPKRVVCTSAGVKNDGVPEQ
jgi:hypothetical protein